MHDLVIKDGTILDPSQNLYEKMDLAVSRGKITEIAGRISESSAKRVLDAKGNIVTPGLIDLHVHVAYNLIRLSIDPEKHCLAKGSTTIVDAGSSGELNFRPFNEFVIKKSKIRILAFLNIESLGMIEFEKGGKRNTDQMWPKFLDDDSLAPMFANLKAIKRVLNRNKETLVGLKWAHHSLTLLKLARKVADDVHTRIMAESHYVPESFNYLKSGDIATHIFHYARHGITKRRDGITEDLKKIHDEVFDAKRRGVIFDVGHGAGSFSYPVARLALREDLEPDTISTDLWVGNVDGPVFDLPSTMSKFLHLGMSLEKVVRASSTKPAEVLGREKEIGILKPGALADIAILKLVEQKRVLTDSYGRSEVAKRFLAPIHVVNGGEVIR